ncbi:MAG: sigma-70 family RNA polymerase sigma factor [Eubacteriales bacterium]|nr:sigma-70 family RNA polymerase sigma factor [Eubacteriales bacterium]
MKPEINETNFIPRLKARDPAALDYVVQTYGALLKGIIRKYLREQPHGCDECVNDCLLAIWEHSAAFDPARSTFANWAAGIARLKALDYQRKQVRRLSHEQPTETISEYALQTDLSSPLLEQTLSEELESMLACLSPQDRALFLKLYIEEKTVEAAAQETGLTKDTVYSRISRGRKRIRTLFPRKGEV